MISRKWNRYKKREIILSKLIMKMKIAETFEKDEESKDSVHNHSVLFSI